MVLIADDTDIFVLLITQLKGDLGQHCLYLKQQVSERMINISNLINCIPDEKKNTLLLNHAMSGCDTTSSFFGYGKTKLYKKGVLEKYQCSQKCFTVLLAPEKTSLEQARTF